MRSVPLAHSWSCKFCNLDDLFSNCDQTSLHLPMLQRTRCAVAGASEMRYFEAATSLVLAVATQALAVGVVLTF
jgi:hypothetical protein